MRPSFSSSAKPATFAAGKRKRSTKPSHPTKRKATGARRPPLPMCQREGNRQLNSGQRRVVEQVAAGGNVCVTGPAGTGKTAAVAAVASSILSTRGGAGMVLTATTGSAASVVGGVTLHSFFGVPPRTGEDGRSAQAVAAAIKPYKRKQIVDATVLFIDEVSMLLASFFDVLEEVARIVRGNMRPFGGLQLVTVGDFLQLPPVRPRGVAADVCIYAFAAKSWPACFPPEAHVRLVESFRQAGDSELWEILCAVRTGTVTDEQIARINSRVFSDLDPTFADAYCVFTHNKQVDVVNDARMRDMNGQARTYDAYNCGASQRDKEALARTCKAAESLTLKVGMVVEVPVNHPPYYNGLTGKVVSLGDDTNPFPVVDFEAPVGRTCVKPVDFTHEREGTVVAWRRQIPLLPACAGTVHRSQGKTRPRIRTNLSRCFEDGQAYTALSRVPALAMISMEAPISRRNIKVNALALAFETEGSIPTQVVK